MTDVALDVHVNLLLYLGAHFFVQAPLLDRTALENLVGEGQEAEEDGTAPDNQWNDPRQRVPFDRFAKHHNEEDKQKSREQIVPRKMWWSEIGQHAFDAAVGTHV